VFTDYSTARPKEALMIRPYQTAIVTGASRGIGIHIARALAQEGMNLVLAARSAGELQRAADTLAAAGGRVIAVPTDIGDRAALARLVSAAEAAFGPVDVLVNNAALDGVMPFHLEDAEAVDRILRINLAAPMQLTRLVLPGMLQRRQGHIVNIASLAAKIPFAYDVTYAASKAGLVHFTASLRAECRGTGVSASTILAGQFRDVGMVSVALSQAGVARPGSVPTSAPEAAGRAVVHAIRHDRPEVAIPAPALLFAHIPRLGALFLRQTGVAGMVRELAGAHGQTRRLAGKDTQDDRARSGAM
jgi:short-subunit dehydrogenase